MSSPRQGRPNSVFAARLDRVADARAPIEANKVEVSVLPDWKENFRYPAALVGAALVGMLAVLVARYVRFQLLGGSLAGDDADITMVIDGAIAAGCSFVLFGILRFHGTDYKAAQSFGIIAMVLGMHNLVHSVPSAFNLVFSQGWTNEVIAYTEPNSILFRGISIVLIEPQIESASQSESESEVPTVPTVRRAGKL
ncbi:hypothetical protein N9L47_04375 [Rhodobacteraceae bacterium]|nr:hypothetical protein [Paracoccaceae bacterium]